MIRYVTENWEKKYEAFLSSHPKGHFVKSLKWAEFKKPWKTKVFVSVDEKDQIRGSMMIYISRIPKTKYTHLYCPRGPVVDDGDAETLKELCDEARKIAKEFNAYELSIDPDITEKDTGYFADLVRAGFALNNTKRRPEYLQARYVFRLYMEGMTADEIFANFHSKTRYNVRLATRKEVTCRIGTKEDLPAFVEVMKETAVRDGFLARSLSYFEEMYDILGPEHLRLYLMEYNGEVLAGAVTIYYDDKMWYLYGASSNRERNRMPNYLMQWEMIQWAVEKGCRIYDFRGVTGDMEKTLLEGLVRFKAGFGAVQDDFVGKMDMIFMPVRAEVIEIVQTAYRALVRRIGVWKNKRK